MENKRKYVRYVTKKKLDKVCRENHMHIRRYFNFKNMSLSDDTKKAYQADFNQFLVFVNERYNEGDIDEEDIVKLINSDNGVNDIVDVIEHFMSFCANELNNKERRMQRRMSSLSSFFLFLMQRRQISTNPMDYLQRIRVKVGEKPQVKKIFLTEAQIKKIRRELKKEEDLQLECFFELALSTMARVKALTSIKVDQINYKTSRIEEVLEKEGYIVNLFPSERSFKAIDKWLDYRRKAGIDSEYLFISRYNKEWNNVAKNTIQSVWMKKIGAYVNEPLSAHDLRRSGSDLLYKRGMKLEEVSSLLNHSGTDVTRNHYLQEDFDKLQDNKRKFEI